MNAFTCTGPYAMPILSGVKQVGNRSAMPVPMEGPSFRTGIVFTKKRIFVNKEMHIIQGVNKCEIA